MSFQGTWKILFFLNRPWTDENTCLILESFGKQLISKCSYLWFLLLRKKREKQEIEISLKMCFNLGWYTFKEWNHQKCSFRCFVTHDTEIIVSQSYKREPAKSSQNYLTLLDNSFIENLYLGLFFSPLFFMWCYFQNLRIWGSILPPCFSFWKRLSVIALSLIGAGLCFYQTCACCWTRVKAESEDIKGLS